VPFETFKTDEPLQRRAKKGPDLDTVMLFGCSGFVVVALVSWGLVVWPFFIFTDAHELRSLELCAALGMLPACVFGAVASRLFGLSGAAGFLGGSICSATFLYLRLQQVMAFRGVPETPQPEYPTVWGWLIPLGWVMASVIVIVLFLQPKEYALEANPPSPKPPSPAPDAGDAEEAETEQKA